MNLLPCLQFYIIGLRSVADTVLSYLLYICSNARAYGYITLLIILSTSDSLCADLIERKRYAVRATREKSGKQRTGKKEEDMRRRAPR